MLTGKKDTDFIVLAKLNDEDLLNLCNSFESKNKYIYQICKDENFWMNRTFQKYGKVEKNPDRSWKDFYLVLLYYINKYNLPLAAAAKKDDNLDIIKVLTNLYRDNVELALINASEEGSLEIVKYLISQGASNLNWVLYYAKTSEIRDYLQSLGAKEFDPDESEDE